MKKHIERLLLSVLVFVYVFSVAAIPVFAETPESGDVSEATETVQEDSAPEEEGETMEEPADSEEPQGEMATDESQAAESEPAPVEEPLPTSDDSETSSTETPAQEQPINMQVDQTEVEIPYVELKLKNEATGIKVTWTAVSGIDGYKLYRKEQNADSWTTLKTIKDPKTTQYKDTSAKEGTTYAYRIRAYKTVDGKKHYGAGDEGRSIRRWVAAPALKKAKNDGADGIVIHWKAVSGAEKYRVYRKDSTTKKWKRIGDTPDTSFTDQTELTVGKKYRYTVRCISSDGKTVQSDFDHTGVAVKKQTATPRVISAVQNGNSITIRWRQVSGAHKYRLLRRESTGTWKVVGDFKSTKKTYTDSKNLKNKSTYFYTVQCVSADGGSVESTYDKTGVGLIYNAKNLPVQPIRLTEKDNAVFIGDSWTFGSGAYPTTNRFSTRLAQMMGMQEYNFGVGGAGFIIKSKPFSAQLKVAADTMSDQEKEDTRYVFITGGVNDVRHYGTQDYFDRYSSAVYQACCTALEQFPNARIILAQGTMIESGGLQSYHDMVDACNAYLDANLKDDRVLRIPSVGLLLAKSNMAYWRSDGLHPSNKGHSLLASYLYTYICKGSMSVGQYCDTVQPGKNVTVKKACKIWKSKAKVYIKQGKYSITKKVAKKSSIKIGSFDQYLAPEKTVTADAKSGSRVVGKIRIDPNGSITFTASKAFKGEITIPKITWACLGADDT